MSPPPPDTPGSLVSPSSSVVPDTAGSSASSAPPAPATDGSSWDAVGSGARCTSLAPLSQAASASRAMRGRVRCPARTLFLLLLFRRRILTDRPLPDASTHETRFLLQVGYS